MRFTGRIVLHLLLLPGILLYAPICHGKEGPVEDVIDLHVADRELIAVRQGAAVSREALGLDEAVLWQGSRGYVGAVLTSERLLAVSKTSSGWVELGLRLAEARPADPPDVHISERLLLMTTKLRMVGFDSYSNRFAALDFPIHDRLVDTAIDSHVAVVVTSGSAFGLARGVSRFVEAPLRKSERLLAVSASPYTASVRTSRRLLLFKSSGAYWREVDAD
jgi:hypothetical protein